MDSKNVIAAISLSAAVIILYGLFFAPEPQQIQKTQQQNEIVKDSEAPKLIETQEIKSQSQKSNSKSDWRFKFRIQIKNSNLNSNSNWRFELRIQINIQNLIQIHI